MSTGPTTPIVPVTPDFHTCGTLNNDINFNWDSCFRAANSLPVGDTPRVYTVGGQQPYSLPSHVQEGGCRVILEIAGPAAATTPHIMISPNLVRGMAFHVIDACVRGEGAKGGWVTNGLESVISVLAELTTDYVNTVWPPDAWFLTLTIDHGMEPKPATGDLSWYLPTLIAYLLGRAAAGVSERKEHYLTGADIYGTRGMVARLDQGTAESKPWWARQTTLPPTASSGMDYQCDKTLGTPRAADCSHIEFSKLGYLSDAFTIGPGASKAVSSNYCGINISSEIRITINWAQVKAALDALINLCVSSSLQVGGRAAYGLGPGMKVSTRDLSASNALPPHVHLTLHQPGHFKP